MFGKKKKPKMVKYSQLTNEQKKRLKKILKDRRTEIELKILEDMEIYSNIFEDWDQCSQLTDWWIPEFEVTCDGV